MYQLKFVDYILKFNNYNNRTYITIECFYYNMRFIHTYIIPAIVLKNYKFSLKTINNNKFLYGIKFYLINNNIDYIFNFPLYIYL
jgi:hypothetical protein